MGRTEEGCPWPLVEEWLRVHGDDDHDRSILILCAECLFDLSHHRLSCPSTLTATLIHGRLAARLAVPQA